MPLLKLRSEPFFDDKNRAFWILQSAGWTGYLILRSLGGLANNMGLLFVVPTALTTATGYSLTLLMASAYRRLIRVKPIYTWTISIVILLVSAAAFSSIETWAHATFYRPREMPEGIQFFGAILLDVALLAAWSALYYGINFYLLLEEQSDRVERLEHQASSAQLEMLRYQLNPHFLFNTLNSISTLVLLKETQRANAMLSRLSNFLRYTLATEAAGTVSLAQEIETLKLYLDIEKMRFEDRLRPVFDVDPAANEARLPSLLLQPLVENAVKYAVTPLEEGADIRIEARIAGGLDERRLVVTVTDTGPGLTDGQTRPTYSTGVGLANIRDRLAQAYGADQRFEVQTGRDEGFGVVIDIPFQTEQQHKDAA